jgi:hypothetical protein
LICTTHPWIYADGQPARLVTSPFLTLVAGLKAFCGKPCGWVINQVNYIRNTIENAIGFGVDRGYENFLVAAQDGQSPNLDQPGFHPDAQSKISAGLLAEAVKSGRTRKRTRAINLVYRYDIRGNHTPSNQCRYVILGRYFWGRTMHPKYTN